MNQNKKLYKSDVLNYVEMSSYGKHCACGHGITAHKCIERQGSWRYGALFFCCNCGCHAVIRTGKEGKHKYKVCGCKEYKNG